MLALMSGTRFGLSFDNGASELHLCGLSVPTILARVAGQGCLEILFPSAVDWALSIGLSSHSLPPKERRRLLPRRLISSRNH